MVNQDENNNKPESSPSNSITPSIRGGSLVLNDQILPPNLFVLPINNPVVFPTLLAPILVSQPRQVAMIEEAINRQRMLGLLLIRNGENKDDAKPENLYDVGVAVKIIKRLKMPDGSVNFWFTR